ncbi:uncharacterized protein BDR25DRAFT_17909 [Lindgomyces ingoldianus]|uniref:Uncharacterized protein n=1 Tax=Lindgomyces ingoldianus TaxID=673940 RepID=A0ACB6QYU2_9PLEO|nr:uncharacterized protein BDR25DRAFT_17909 [Lindgomyces ingoldianus]KAF2472061.1 hypothetical protein BDR25DRAFT_17909 [Lindgomyces ingoldianus]
MAASRRMAPPEWQPHQALYCAGERTGGPFNSVPGPTHMTKGLRPARTSVLSDPAASRSFSRHHLLYIMSSHDGPSLVPWLDPHCIMLPSRESSNGCHSSAPLLSLSTCSGTASQQYPRVESSGLLGPAPGSESAMPS